MVNVRHCNGGRISDMVDSMSVTTLLSVVSDTENIVVHSNCTNTPHAVYTIPMGEQDRIAKERDQIASSAVAPPAVGRDSSVNAER